MTLCIRDLCCLLCKYLVKFTNYYSDDSSRKSDQPLLLYTNTGDVPAVIKDTLDLYKKYVLKQQVKSQSSRSINLREREMIYDSLFMLRCVYDGKRNIRYVKITEAGLKPPGAKECYEWFCERNRDALKS